MKKRDIPKINSIHFGGRWIGIGVLIGAVIPFVIWLLFHVFLWGLCVIGGMILAGFVIVFAIEMHRIISGSLRKGLKKTRSTQVFFWK